MVDNTTLNVMSGGDVIASDDIGGVKYQIVKVSFGPLDTATPVSTSNGLPVEGRGTAGSAAGGVLSVQGVASMTALKVDGSAVTQPVQAGKSAIVSANFTRPANTTAYAIGQLVANSTTAGSVAPLSFSNVVRVSGAGALLRKAKLRKSGTSTTSASFRIHFYAVTETSSVGDGVAIVLPDMANYRGSIDVTLDKATSDGSLGFGLPAVGDSIIVNPASGTSLFAFIEARAAYTPISGEVFTVELDLIQD